MLFNEGSLDNYSSLVGKITDQNARPHLRWLSQTETNRRQPYHPTAQDRLPTEAKQGWAGQYLDGRPPGKTRLLLEEVLVRPAGGAHPVVCVGPNAPV